MSKVMRTLPFFMAVFFMLVTYNRVAILMDTGFNAGIVGWFFSAGMEIGEFLMSYYMRATIIKRKSKTITKKVRGVDVTEKVIVEEEDSRSKQLRYIAFFGLIIFSSIDAYFNMTQVLRELTEQSLFIASIIYGLFPTIATILLGYMQANIDAMPKPIIKKGSTEYYMNSLLTGWFETAVMKYFYKREIMRRNSAIEIENLKRQAKAIASGRFDRVELIKIEDEREEEKTEQVQERSPEPETKSDDGADAE